MKQIALPALVLLFLVGMATIALWPAGDLDADHYQRFHNPQTLYSVLNSSVSSGTSVTDVEKLIGPGVPMADGVDEYRAELKSMTLRYPQQYPDGVHDLDTFQSWAAGNGAVTLQFRNGWLVNHDPAQFAVYRPDYAVAGRQSGPIDLQVGGFDDQ